MENREIRLLDIIKEDEIKKSDYSLDKTAFAIIKIVAIIVPLIIIIGIFPYNLLLSATLALCYAILMKELF